MLEFRFDTQLLIEGHGLDEDAIHDYIQRNIAGDCLLAVGDEDLIKIHFHTNTPWKVLEYCAGLGDIHDIVIEKHGASGKRPARLIFRTRKPGRAFALPGFPFRMQLFGVGLCHELALHEVALVVIAPEAR